MIVGIDLGTTNSLVGAFRDGQVELAPNALGHVLTPSAVSIGDDGQVLVGLAARERLGLHPGRTAVAFKRWMGTGKQVRLGGRDFRAEELSALVLRSLIADARQHFGEPADEAVITVPAYFNEAQRRATKTAAELAGLKVRRLLNEPTAAGLAYGLQDKPDHTTFLVLDLGGGTFDVSVIEYFEGVVEVRASAGDTRLGGEDFTAAIHDWLLRRAGLDDAAREEMAHARTLWRVAEQLKRDLSQTESAHAACTLPQGLSIDAMLDRAGFESQCAELLQRLRRPIERALSDARIDTAQLDAVVLVGGATRMPIVRQLVARLFQRLPLRLVDPDEAVARGAAVQAALCARDAALDEVVLTDVMPYSLGVTTMEAIRGQRVADCFVPILERNTPLPVSRSKVFSTVMHNQPFVRIDVRQGESAIASDNLLLATVQVPVPPQPAGTVPVEVRFSYDVNGLLEIDVHEAASGQRAHRVVQQTPNGMNEQELSRSLERLSVLKIHPRDKQENQFLLERGRRLFEDRLGEERSVIGESLAAFEAVLQGQDEAAIRRARSQFKAFLDQIDRGFVL
ncbi:MAG: molecular chaperone HscC [Aquabacterium sp.]|nr:MAG: molecular chaperone HscC [Aquabacterium sp.]